jgi:hypothetical protein
MRRLVALVVLLFVALNAWPLAAAVSWPFIRRTIPAERAQVLAALNAPRKDT